MFTTVSSLDTQLGLIPPQSENYLIVTATNNDFYEPLTKIFVFAPGQWNKSIITKQLSSVGCTNLTDWKLTRFCNNAPHEVYCPEGMQIIIDAVYVCSQGFWVHKAIEVNGYGEKINLEEEIYIHSASRENEYFYLGYRIECNPNFIQIDGEKFNF